MLNCLFHPKAEKELDRLPSKIREQIKAKIEQLTQLAHPLQHPKVRKLRGESDKFRMKSGDYRIKFVLINTETVKITHIQHRQVGY